jgi:hypothetical protein
VDVPILTILKHVLIISLITVCRVSMADPEKVRDFDASVNDFATKYKSAVSEKEKLELCIDAIDADVIPHGTNVTIDEIFGTSYGSSHTGHSVKGGVVHFGRHYPGKVINGIQTAASDPGWSLFFKFDKLGKIEKYYLTNIFKGFGKPNVQNPQKLKELSDKYLRAASEIERLRICIAAIDEGLISTSVDAVVIDEVFGKDSAKEVAMDPKVARVRDDLKAAAVRFGPSSDGKANSENAASEWCFVFEIHNSGTISNYYLTKLGK